MTSMEIPDAAKSVVTADQLRQDTELIMKPYADWEKYLTPAPLTIALLGELVFISSKEDFSINKNPPKDGFVHIKYPESFRATLMQVCHAGWGAFNEAHTSMDQIRLQTANIPNYIRKALEVIQRDDERLLKKVLPRILETIGNLVSECVRLSTSTTVKFGMIISLVEEVQLAATNAKGKYTEDLKTTEMNIEKNKHLKEDKKKAEEDMAEESQLLRSRVEEAERKLTEALKSMPSGNELTRLHILDGLTTLQRRIHGGKSAAQVEVENSRIRIEQAVKALETAREEMKVAQEKEEKNKDEIRAILLKLMDFNVQKIDFETTLAVLKEGLKALGMVEAQWKMMVQFFQFTANIISQSLKDCSQGFITDGNDFLEDNNDFYKGSLYNQSFKVNNIASLVQTISGTYTEISAKHFMPGVSSLGALMGLEANSEEFKSERKKLQDSCHEADNEIASLVKKNMDDFDKKTGSRIDQLGKVLALMGQKE